MRQLILKTALLSVMTVAVFLVNHAVAVSNTIKQEVVLTTDTSAHVAQEQIDDTITDNGGTITTPAGSIISGHVKQPFSLVTILRGLLGMLVLISIGFLISQDRRYIPWKTVIVGLTFQMLLAVSILYVPFVRSGFEFFGLVFVKILDFTKAGSEFVFGSLVDMNKFGYIFAFQILPTIIFFSALTSMLFYWGIIQRVVWVLAWLFTRFMKLAGAEALSVAGNIFLGQTESPLLIKAYLPNMSKSEIMLVMTSGMATMAGGVLAAYIGLLGGNDPLMRLEFAKHLLAASVMAAPGAVVFAKMIVPNRGNVSKEVKVTKDKIGSNILDAITNGTSEGIKLAVNVAGMLITFIALIAMFNFIIGKAGDWMGINEAIEQATDGRFSGLSLQLLLGYMFAPVMWLIGVHSQDIMLVGRLIGEKLILTEFIGYISLTELKEASAFYEYKSVIVSTYILSGFANFASIGIQIGGIGALAPNQRITLSKCGIYALMGGTLASMMSATIIGMLLG